MYDLMLAPMGAEAPPASVDEAVETYLVLRDQLEECYGVDVPRKLESAVRPQLSRARRRA
jgi:hypothetical protein